MGSNLAQLGGGATVHHELDAEFIPPSDGGIGDDGIRARSAVRWPAEG